MESSGQAARRLQQIRTIVPPWGVRLLIPYGNFARLFRFALVLLVWSKVMAPGKTINQRSVGLLPGGGETLSDYIRTWGRLPVKAK